MTVSEYLARHGITAGRLARQLKVPRKSVYQWARGAIPRGANLQRLTEGTDGAVTLDSMLAAQEAGVPPSPPPPARTRPAPRHPPDAAPTRETHVVYDEDQQPPDEAPPARVVRRGR